MLIALRNAGAYENCISTNKKIFIYIINDYLKKEHIYITFLTSWL